MIPHFDLTDDERVSAAWDSYLCQNLMARFVLSQELGMEKATFDALWYSGEDISFGNNQGFYIGRNSVAGFFVKGRARSRAANMEIQRLMTPEFPPMPDAGGLNRKNLMSPLVEVARDGKTAKGMWYCPGVRTQMEVDGHIHLDWHYVRYGADFILEGDQWRIWHLFEGSEFAFEMGHGYIPATGMDSLPDATVYEENPLISHLPLGQTLLPPPDLPATPYSIKYGWSAYPAVPVPYETFEETFTYGPEPFMSQQKEEEAP